MGNELPLLIAKQKEAKFLKEYYKLGWLIEDETQWFWTVWGATPNFENAKKIAKQVIEEKGKRNVFLSNQPLPRDSIQNKSDLNLIDITNTLE